MFCLVCHVSKLMCSEWASGFKPSHPRRPRKLGKEWAWAAGASGLIVSSHKHPHPLTPLCLWCILLKPFDLTLKILSNFVRFIPWYHRTCCHYNRHRFFKAEPLSCVTLGSTPHPLEPWFPELLWKGGCGESKRQEWWPSVGNEEKQGLVA